MTAIAPAVCGGEKRGPVLAGGREVKSWVADLHDSKPQVRRQAVLKLERFTVGLHTLWGRCEYTPLYPPFVRGEKNGAVPPQFFPPYEGGIQGGSAGEDFECAQANC